MSSSSHTVLPRAISIGLGIISIYGIFAIFAHNFALFTGAPPRIAYPVGGAGLAIVAALLLGARSYIISASAVLTDTIDAVAPIPWVICCILCGLAARIAWNIVFPPVQTSDMLAYVELARGLLQRHEYYIAESYAFWPPGLPFALVPALVLVGDHAWTPLFNNSLTFALAVLAVYCLARRLLDHRLAKIATLLTVLWPNLLFLSGLASKELLLVALLPIALCLYLHAVRSETPARASGWALLAGLPLGYGMLTQPSLLLIPSLFVLYELIRRDFWRHRLARLIPLLVGALLIVSPWTARNYRVLDAFVPVNTAGGSSLYVANHPGATGGYVPGAMTFLAGHDEVAADRIARGHALEWIRQHPAAFALLAVKKHILLLGDDGVGAYATVKRGLGISDVRYVALKGVSNLYWLLILSLVAVVIYRHRSAPLLARPELALLALTPLYSFVLHSVFESDGRHHVAVAGPLAIIAALALRGACPTSDRSAQLSPSGDAMLAAHAPPRALLRECSEQAPARMCAAVITPIFGPAPGIAKRFRLGAALSLAGLCLLVLLPGAALGQPEPPNTLTIFETSGTTQVDRPVSIARPFRPGEIRHFVRALVNGAAVLTQNDVKNRWSDGSLKFAIISFVIPHLPAGGSVSVALTEQPTTDVTGFLTQDDMLARRYDFDATINARGASAQTVSAREILAAGHWRYWLRGPVVTAVIIEDRTAARRYDKDFGDGSKALHPIFEAWFYPRNGTVDVGYTLENTWASSTPSRGMRDLTYSLTLTAGHLSPTVQLVHPPFKHIGKSRWHKRHWLGPTPRAIRVDHNMRYLVSTRAIPNYDTSLKVAEPLVTGRYKDWLAAPKSIDGGPNAIGTYEKGLSAAGANDWIGLLTTWDTIYLLTMDEGMHRMAIGNADLAGRIPWHYREADRSAGTGHYFDVPGSGSVDTHGRVVSINARRTVSLWDLSPSSDCGAPYRADRINTGPVSSDGWVTTRDHMPETAYLAYLLTGRYYYLEELQYLAAFIVAHRTGCYSDVEVEHRQGHNGYLHDSQLRGDAWGFRTLAYAAFLSPDGTAEKAYFEDKLKSNIAAWEGAHDIPLSDSSHAAHWKWAKAHLRDSRGPSPLGIWQDLGPAGVQPPLHTDGRLKSGGAGWEEHFLLVALGMARGFGYQTDGLLRFMARLRLNLLLNPEANRYLMDTYRWPHKLAGTDDWVKTYEAFTRQYRHPPTSWAVEGTADHGYGFIALAATSYLTPYTVGVYSGEAAWALYKSQKPGQERFATESPKWAILPLPSTVPVSSRDGRPSPSDPGPLVTSSRAQRPPRRP
jgi:4-amino-4-deoxy-L-arabinose transferase-like glycosyltransferase